MHHSATETGYSLEISILNERTVLQQQGTVAISLIGVDWDRGDESGHRARAGRDILSLSSLQARAPYPDSLRPDPPRLTVLLWQKVFWPHKRNNYKVPANRTSKMSVKRYVESVVMIVIAVVYGSGAEVLGQLHRTREHRRQDLKTRCGEGVGRHKGVEGGLEGAGRGNVHVERKRFAKTF